MLHAWHAKYMPTRIDDLDRIIERDLWMARFLTSSFVFSEARKLTTNKRSYNNNSDVCGLCLNSRTPELTTQQLSEDFNRNMYCGPTV